MGRPICEVNTDAQSRRSLAETYLYDLRSVRNSEAKVGCKRRTRSERVVFWPEKGDEGEDTPGEE